MKHLLFAWLLFSAAAIAADSASLNGNARVVFIGDSITGQGGGWLGAGYVFKVREALSAAYPDAKPDLVPLGGSGMGVGSWLSLAKNGDKQKNDLDVKGVEVAAALAKPADVMIVMLGMNDVLAPYVNETEESLDQWLANYRELITTLSARLKPKVIGLATITPQTEDPGTPKNRVMSRMNERIAKLAAELKARLRPTNAMYWDALNQARRTQPDFSLAGDRIHPGTTGHVVIARAMLSGLGEEKAAEWLQTERLDKTLANLKPGPAPTAPPPWLVASGLILRGWQEKPADADLAPNPIDLAIERGEDFTQALAKEGGAPLAWHPFQSTVNLTDGANPGSVDFAGICFGQNFEAGYGARWIRSDKTRKLKLDLKTSGVGSAIHLTVWLNGQQLYSNLITQEPKHQTSREVELRLGWNVLVFKSCHRTWQWQQAIGLTELDGRTALGLDMFASNNGVQ